MGVATAEACYEWTRSYTKERKAFGKALMDMQTVRHKMAEMKTSVVVARTFLDHCIELHANKRLDTVCACGVMRTFVARWQTSLARLPPFAHLFFKKKISIFFN